MPWFLITVDKEYVQQPAMVKKNTGSAAENIAMKGDVVLGEYKHASGEQAMEDAARAHDLSPFVLNYYCLED
ncbi:MULTISPECIES: hypothetical protein [Bacillus subtilis group]|uniref:hypothetical protein n=1 Tax=Bacillus subtilis group TaxID=653685 RepID=UPI001A9199BE|nr:MULTISPECIES: hypothetical protein [Bacillus subtilis group]MCY9308833.1 hypothetical protein [Bacillus inaquosorum]BCT30408.1 hypothetical protein BVAD3_40820 [Bacillus velezensis]